MRARMALAQAGVEFVVREVVLRDKPDEMLALSSKGTVPVLLVDDTVIDESIDIMHWALAYADEEGWLNHDEADLSATDVLILQCEQDFKLWLDRYKYNDRHPDTELESARSEAERFIGQLENQLTQLPNSDYLFASISLADMAIFPFVRQFANVDRAWFDAAPYPCTQSWLANILTSERFQKIMQKYPQWSAGDEPVVFGSGGGRLR
ncbi:MAG: glutathione S-transferase [Candidatus Azotimanducaceae bacterium]|jgi:glutathione S-transferase